MAQGSEKGGSIVLPVLLSVVAAAAISVGGFGAGFGVGRVVYGSADQPSQSQPAAENQQSIGTSVAGITRGPNVHVDYGAIIWMSTTWPSNPASALDQQPAAPTVTQPAAAQPEAAPSAPAQAPAEPANNAGRTDQQQGQTKPSTSGNSDGVTENQSGGQSQTGVNIAPSSPTTNKPQGGNNSSGVGNQTSNLDWPEGKYLASAASKGKYHRTYCENGMTGAVNIKEENKIWFDSEQEAQDAGYKRCNLCW